MGADFVWAYRGPHETWEDSHLSKLCVRAFTEPGAQLQMDARSFEAQLRIWADNHRGAARIAGRRPGVKHPLLCVAMDHIRDACGPVVPVVVSTPKTHVFQVGINLDDAVTLTGISAPEQTVRRTPDAGRYVLADVVAEGPAMFDTARLGQAGGTDTPTPIPPPGYRPPASTKYSASPPSDKRSQGVVPDFNHLRKAGSVSGNTSSTQVSTRLAEPDAAARRHWHLELS
jgi:hypothetical protein